MRKNVTNPIVRATSPMRTLVLPIALVLLGAAPLLPRRAQAPSRSAATEPPVFYRDVLPILQQHCQSCHRPGEIAPMPFVTYEQTRPFAGAIAISASDKKMPPWFADPSVGKFSNDPSSDSAGNPDSHIVGKLRRARRQSQAMRLLRGIGSKAGTFRSQILW